MKKDWYPDIKKLTRKIINYLKENQLALDSEKIQHVIVTKGNRLLLCIENEMQGVVINENTQCKLFGLILNNKLNWNEHI